MNNIKTIECLKYDIDLIKKHITDLQKFSG